MQLTLLDSDYSFYIHLFSFLLCCYSFSLYDFTLVTTNHHVQKNASFLLAVVTSNASLVHSRDLALSSRPSKARQIVLHRKNKESIEECKYF